ncbi:DUF5667 domain-containing protein [Clostridium grantii]|uniref:DUF5667 domain-containing protein n=1 Tax=Clostridium grantii DSM 8605 TaxID=1121316 RepID=A0A1M5X1D5_9CLOT|nr:DUF5667 domain-containing protein [Clostridium grantii]SHH93540.1 hypothetical protein SAMN02745207_03270 [Clostridium grantii DSM 8605]
MKKTISIILGIFLACSLSLSAFAEGEATLINSAGITPDSFLYPVDEFIEDIALMLANEDEEKVQLLTEIAEERLGESEVMAGEGKEDFAEEALASYDESLNKATEIIEEIINNSELNELDINDTAEESQEQDAINEEYIHGLKNIIDESRDETIEVLENISEKTSEEGKEKLELVIQMQKEKKEAVKNMVEKRHELNAKKKELNSAKAQLIKESKKGDEESVIKVQEEYDLKLVNYNNSKTELNAAKEYKQAINEEYSNNNIEKLEETETNALNENDDKVELKKEDLIKKEQVKEKVEVKKEEVKEKVETKKEEVKEKVEIKKEETKENKGNSKK